MEVHPRNIKLHYLERFREEATSGVATFLVGPLSWSKLEFGDVVILWRE